MLREPVRAPVLVNDAVRVSDSLRGEAFFNVPSGLASFPLGGEQIAEW